MVVKKVLVFAFCIFVFLNFTPLFCAESGDVTARIVSSGIVITNNTSRDVYYEVHEQTMLTRIEWVPICKDKNRLVSKTSILIPANFEPSGRVYVFWWHKGKYLLGHEHYGPDEVRSFIVEKR